LRSNIMADFQITFLGTGTSQGIPMIGCDCAVCQSADPRDKRSRSSIYVETPEAALVVDTGPDFRCQCLRENVRRLDAVVYTHSHTDHILGFDDLRSFCFNRSMPVYASQPTMSDLARVFMFAFNVTELVPGYVRPEPHIIDGPFKIGETTLVPLPAEHGRTHLFGYLFQRNGRSLAAYLSDCKRVSDEVVEKIKGVDLLIIDALRHRPHPTHMNVEEALALSVRVQPGQTWFTHLCHDLGHAETEATLPPGVRIAYDGLKLEI
jgi:phosphoribosyl 1,2-cyclic phosphate phosphodiesterase